MGTVRLVEVAGMLKAVTVGTGAIEARLKPLFLNLVPVELRAGGVVWQNVQLTPVPYVVLYWFK
jgi:hypothetical protein